MDEKNKIISVCLGSVGMSDVECVVMSSVSCVHILVSRMTQY